MDSRSWSDVWSSSFSNIQSSLQSVVSSVGGFAVNNFYKFFIGNSIWSDVLRASFSNIETSWRSVFMDVGGFVGYIEETNRINTQNVMSTEESLLNCSDSVLDNVILKLLCEQLQIKNIKYIAEDKEIMIKMHLRLAYSSLSYDELSKKMTAMLQTPASFITDEVEREFFEKSQCMLWPNIGTKYMPSMQDIIGYLRYHLIHIRLICGDNRFLIYQPKKEFYSFLMQSQFIMDLLCDKVIDCTIPKKIMECSISKVCVDYLENNVFTRDRIKETITYTYVAMKDKRTYVNNALTPAVAEILKEHTKMEIVQWVSRDKYRADAKMAICKYAMTPKEFGDIITAMCHDPLSFVKDETMFRYLKEVVYMNKDHMTQKEIEIVRDNVAACLLYNIAHMRFMKQKNIFFWYKPILHFIPYECVRKEIGRYCIAVTMDSVLLPVIIEDDLSQANVEQENTFLEEIVSDITLTVTERIKEESTKEEKEKEDQSQTKIEMCFMLVQDHEPRIPALGIRMRAVFDIVTAVDSVNVEQSLDIPQEALDLASNAR